MESKAIKVVNCKFSKYDIYIGRGKCPRTGEKSIWGNPYKIGEDGNRQEVIDKYEKYLCELLLQPEYQEEIKKLKGKTLGCWCKPLACHGDIIKKYVESEYRPKPKKED